MKAKKRATERNKLPDINWSDEVEVNSLSARKLKLYLKEHGLPVSGGKAALVARVIGAGEAQGKENPDEQQSSSSEDQVDNEQSDDSEIDDYEEQSFEVLFIPDDAVECVAVRCTFIHRTATHSLHHSVVRDEEHLETLFFIIVNFRIV